MCLDLTLAEMRASLECDKQKVVKDLRQKLEAEKIIAINDTKKKQWVSACVQLVVLMYIKYQAFFKNMF